jgi:sulfite exporter TauE/SafE/copper chaperone CopZ
MKIPEEQKSTKKINLKVEKMVCESCEKILEKSLGNLEGVQSSKISYTTGKGEVHYNPNKTTPEEILTTIEKAGYEAEEVSKTTESTSTKISYIILGLLGALLLVFAYIAVNSIFGSMNISIPQLDANTSIALIFVVGLLTGFHCIGMCGAFVLSYTAKARKNNPKALNLSLHAKYALGKIFSYTLIGGVFGLIGSFFVFTPTLRAIVAILAGLFLILFGLKMLNIFPILRKLSLPQKWFDRLKIGPIKDDNSDPFVIGLLNGLFIACGPLQAMYVLAATTGSFFLGGTMLFAFAIGTLIPMMGFAIFASFISHGIRNNIVKISGIIVLVMGLLMINNGLAIMGNGVSINSIGELFATGNLVDSNSSLQITSQTNAPYQIIRMDVTNNGWEPNSFILKKGVPVKWIINGKELNGCNSGIIVNAYNLNFKINPGEQTIEFAPNKTGTIRWSCWMGMIQGTFIVRDDVEVDSTGKVIVTAQAQQQANIDLATAPKKTGGCGCSGGGAMTCGGN